MALMLHWPILLTAMGGWDISHLESLSLAEPRDPTLSQQSVDTLFDALSLDSSTTSTTNVHASSTEHIPPIANMPSGYDENVSEPIRSFVAIKTKNDPWLFFFVWTNSLLQSLSPYYGLSQRPKKAQGGLRNRKSSSLELNKPVNFFLINSRRIVAFKIRQVVHLI